MLQDNKILAFLKTHSMLADDPSATLNAAELKSWWDSAPEELRVKLNALIDNLASVTPGSSGAELIGSAPITGVTGSTSFAQMSDIRNQLANVVLGQIPDATITQQKMVVDLQNKLNQVVSIQREVANLKAVSSVANRVDGASGIFYDLLDGLNGGSIAKLDTTRTNISNSGNPLTAGSTTCVVKSSAGLSTGMEVTFQDIVDATKWERVVLTGVSGNTLTFAPLVNTYADQAVVYRSLVSVDQTAHTMKFGKATMPTLEGMTKQADPATLPPGNVKGVAYSTDGQYMATTSASGAPYLRIYKITGGVFNKLPDPASVPTASANAVTFSYDGTYMAVGLSASPFIAIYKRNGDTFDRLGDPTGGFPAAGVNAVAFSQDGSHLATVHATTPFVTIYKRTVDSFVKLVDPATLPSGTCTSVTYSSDSVYLAVGSSTSPFINTYKRSGDVYTKLANPATIPGGAVYGVSFSPDTTYLAAYAQTASPYIYIYKRVVDTFTKLPDPASLPPAGPIGVGGNALVFSGDGNYLAMATGATSPYIVTYKRSGDTFSKLADPNVLPAGQANVVAVTQDSTYVTVGLNVSPFIATYSGGSGVDVTQADVRYNITPSNNIDNVAAWAERDMNAGMSLSAALSIHGVQESYSSMSKSTATVDDTTSEDQFTGTAATNNKAVLRVTMNRTSPAVNTSIKQITGAVGT